MSIKKKRSIENKYNVSSPTIGQMLVLPIVESIMSLSSFRLLKNMNIESTCSSYIF